MKHIDGIPSAGTGQEGEKHRQHMAEMAKTDMQGLLADARKSALNRERGKAELFISLAQDALRAHQTKGELTEEEIMQFDAELHEIYAITTLEEAA